MLSLRLGPGLAALVLGFALIDWRASAFVLNGDIWPTGTTIQMQLALGPLPRGTSLQDGFTSWDASAADALAIWNQQIALVKYSWIQNPNVPRQGADGQNAVYFATTIYGQTFGTDVIAVTTHFEHMGSTNYLILTETDTIFNGGVKWNSYRGPLMHNRNTYTFDFHRVALHEFGHTLGLDHPDEHGQSVVAIMNSHTSDLDHITADDIAGVQYIYAPQITSFLMPPSVQVGRDFSYQITSNNNPTNFSASNLPPGLQLDPKTGLISGSLTISGDYQVTLTASGLGIAHDSLLIHVTPWNIGKPVMTINGLVADFAVDKVRNRIYASLTGMGVGVIDCSTLKMTTIPLRLDPKEMSISSDGSNLYLANDSLDFDAKVIDLETFQVVGSLSTSFPTFGIAAGLNNRVYVSGWNDQDHAGIAVFDGISRKLLTMIDSSQVGPAFLALSPDRKILYLGSYDETPTLSAIDVSTATAVVKQRVPGRVSGFDGPLGLSHDGSVISAPDTNGTSWLEIPTSDLSATRTSYSVPGGFTAGAVAFSPDDKVVYLTYVQSGIVIKAFDRSTGEVLATFDTGNGVPDALVTDPSGIFLFAGYSTGSYSPIHIFYTGRPPLNNPVTGPKSLTNVSTRFRVGSGDNVGIGGFIIKGQEAKKIIVRVIGPSLQQFGVSGAMTDPVLELHDFTGATIATNDNWSSNQLAVVTTGRAPSNEHEAALVATLQPGSYTAIARGAGGATGVCLLEIYDIDPLHSRLTNVSSRGQVQTGDNVIIGGFIIGGSQPTKVVVRALGPSLGDFGVGSVLADPMLELHDGNGNLIAQNDDWESDQLNAIQTSGYAPPNQDESAILATLPPGNYTAIVRGKNGTIGVALVEVYNLNAQ